MQMSKRPLSAADMEVHLNEQLGALQRSVALFDVGYQVEARRMAVILRVLLHSGKDPSLLKRLGRDQMDFVDSAVPFDPDNLLAHHGLVSIRFDDNQISYVPHFDTVSKESLTPFDNWWKAIVFADRQGAQLSRLKVVLIAANQDGGAHVDATIDAVYSRFRQENSLGWVNGQGIPPFGDPVYTAIRQIVHEVLKTFIRGYSKTIEDILLARKKSEVSGGKMRFFPHEKQFFKSETVLPLVPGLTYVAEVIVDSITTGCVRIVVNSAVAAPLTLAGKHIMYVVAGQEQYTGVFGEYTDAVLDRMSLKQAE